MIQSECVVKWKISFCVLNKECDETTTAYVVIILANDKLSIYKMTKETDLEVLTIRKEKTLSVSRAETASRPRDIYRW